MNYKNLVREIYPNLRFGRAFAISYIIEQKHLLIMGSATVLEEKLWERLYQTLELNILKKLSYE